MGWGSVRASTPTRFANANRPPPFRGRVTLRRVLCLKQLEHHHSPSSVSAQRSTRSLLRKSSAARSAVASCARSAATVATTTSHLSLKAMASAGTRRAVAHLDLIGTAAALHPADGDEAPFAQTLELVAVEFEIADAIQFVVIRDAGRTVAEPELGAEIDVDLGAAIGGAAMECLAGTPLVERERPLHLGPDPPAGAEPADAHRHGVARKHTTAPAGKRSNDNVARCTVIQLICQHAPSTSTS